MKMTKLLLAMSILFLFCFTGCKKEKNEAIENFYIGVFPVDMVCNIEQEKSYVTLSIVTTLDIQHIDVVLTNVMQKVNIQKYAGIKLKKDKVEREGNLFETTILFKNEPVVLTNIQVQYHNQVKKLEIGRYKSVVLSQNEKLSSNIQEVYQPEEDTYQLQSFIYNHSIRNLYLEKITSYESLTSHTMIEYTLDTSKCHVMVDGIVAYQHIYLKCKEGYYQIENILVFHFLTNLKEEKVYASYYINQTPLLSKMIDTGIDVTILNEGKLT